MFDLFGLVNSISSQVVILSVILGLVSLVVVVTAQGTVRGIVIICLILILITLVLVLKDAEKTGIWLEDLILKPNAGFIFLIRGQRF